MTSTARSTQIELCRQFRAMHETGPVLQIANAWDESSARMLEACGAPAIGTTSFGVALANGYADGEQIPWETARRVAASIVAAVAVPVTVDIEAGRGGTPSEVSGSVSDILDAGAAGINIEDSVPGSPGELFPIDDQAARYAAARDVATEMGVPLFINARCDVFFGATIDADARVDEVLERAKSYAAAGVDGLFLPGLLDPVVLRTITASIDLPVNVMVGTGAPRLEELATAGVRRISQGGEPFIAVLGMLKLHSDEYLAGNFGAPIATLGAGASLLGALMS